MKLFVEAELVRGHEYHWGKETAFSANNNHSPAHACITILSHHIILPPRRITRFSPSRQHPPTPFLMSTPSTHEKATQEAIQRDPRTRKILPPPPFFSLISSYSCVCVRYIQHWTTWSVACPTKTRMQCNATLVRPCMHFIHLPYGTLSYWLPSASCFLVPWPCLIIFCCASDLLPGRTWALYFCLRIE